MSLLMVLLEADGGKDALQCGNRAWHKMVAEQKASAMMEPPALGGFNLHRRGFNLLVLKNHQNAASQFGPAAPGIHLHNEPVTLQRMRDERTSNKMARFVFAPTCLSCEQGRSQQGRSSEVLRSGPTPPPPPPRHPKHFKDEWQNNQFELQLIKVI